MNLKKWLWLMSIQNIGAKRAINLYDYFGSIDEIYENEDISKYNDVKGINLDIATSLTMDKDLNKFDRIVDKMYEENINYITMDDKYYPYSLKEIYDYPPLLFYKGKNLFIEENPMISIVGTRRASGYGMSVAENFAREFSNKGLDVVSGLAAGIDTYAHMGALKGFGDTVAVLGCGVDKVYPKRNMKLYEQIIERGMVISEYFPGTEPLSHHFPARNRIISGLSQGTIVIEASYKSGSLITARYANEQGREVYAVPGNITSSMCEGSNSLLKDGAKLILSANDVLEDLYYVLNKGPLDRLSDIIDVNEDSLLIANKEGKLDKYELSEEERLVCQAILDGDNTSDLLNEKLNIEINLINSILTMLEIRGIVISTGAKLMVK